MIKGDWNLRRQRFPFSVMGSSFFLDLQTRQAFGRLFPPSMLIKKYTSGSSNCDTPANAFCFFPSTSAVMPFISMLFMLSWVPHSVYGITSAWFQRKFFWTRADSLLQIALPSAIPDAGIEGIKPPHCSFLPSEEVYQKQNSFSIDVKDLLRISFVT